MLYTQPAGVGISIKVPLNVPWKISWLLEFQISIVPPVNEKQFVPQETRAPVVTLTVPRMPAVVVPFWTIDSNCEVILRVPPATTQFEAVVHETELPPFMKVMLAVVPREPAFP